MARDQERTYRLEFEQKDGTAEAAMANAGISTYRMLSTLDGRKCDWAIVDGERGFCPVVIVTVATSDVSYFDNVENTLSNHFNSLSNWVEV